MLLKELLFPHQISGAEFLINKKKALLLHEQGLGKTATALAAFEKLKELKKAKSCLIVAEASLLWQWEREIKRFTDSSYIVVDRNNTEARNNYEHRTDYTLISYDLYIRDFSQILTSKWDVIIGDEIQVISNHKSKRSKLLKRYNVINNPVYRWALTGTAIRNKLEDLYSIMYWVDKTFLPSWYIFEKKHIIRAGIGITGYKNLKPLHEYLKNKVHRCTHEDVEGKIPKIIGPVIYSLEPSLNYQEKQNDLLKTLDLLHEDIRVNDFIFPSTKSQVAKAFNKCKQLLSGSDKVDYLVQEVQKVLEENEINKIVVFSFYKEPLYLLEKSLSEKGIKSVKFTGDESYKTRKRNIQEFENSTRVLLASNAGSKGLDLPRANYVYHIDVPFSFDILDQRNKRITRLSSTHQSVVVNYLITNRSIEKFYFDIALNQGELLKAAFDESKDRVKIKTKTLRQYLDEYR